MSKALLIFIKNPKQGNVKTRLATDIGSQKALRVYQDLLKHTRHVTQQVSCHRYLYYSRFVVQNDGWPETEFEKRVQQGASLGERMSNAFQQAFEEGHQRVIIIGSDCYEISPTIIQQAFEALHNNDFVIGPAQDGGYYLLGMQHYHPFIFQNKQWSTDSVLQNTLTDIQQREWSVKLLSELNDIDTIEDLERYNRKKGVE